MLKELFEGHFYGTFPKTDDRLLELYERFTKGDFSILDTQACCDCINVCSDDVASREQLKIHSDGSVSIISIEQVFDFVKEEMGERCDYMLESDRAVALVEMTCSTSSNVKDKRQKAKRQLYNTLCKLFSSHVIKLHIEKHASRYVVFSWKETFSSDKEDDIVERNMADMTIMSDVVYSPFNELQFEFGFKLREIRFPDVLCL